MLTGLLQAAWPVLAGVAVRVTPLFLVALLAERILRRGSAALRHAIWRATLVGTIALGIGTAALPGWRVAVLPRRPAPPAVSEAPVARAARSTITPAPRTRVVRDVAFTARAVPLGAGLVLLWSAVAGTMVLRMLLDLRALGHSSRKARRLMDGPLADLTAALARDLGIERQVRVLLHDGGVIPHAFGLWRPTIALPREATTWDRDRLTRVITHELGHVQRGDALECVLVRCVRAMLWFHPGAWLLARRLADTREAACDDIVLLRGARASDYATDLLDAVRTVRRGRLPAVVPAMASGSELGVRLSDILDATRARRFDARVPRRLMGVALVVLAAPLAALQPVPRADVHEEDAGVPERAPRTAPAAVPVRQPSSRRQTHPARAETSARFRARAASGSHPALITAHLASLDSICAVTNGRTRGELLMALADQWVEDDRFREAYFRVLDGIPDARVRADVVVRALTASRTSQTRELARTIIDGFPDRGLRDAMADHLSQTY